MITNINESANYDTKLIAKYLKAKFDDEAFGTSKTIHGTSDAERYMNRNNLVYDSATKTVGVYQGSDWRNSTPIYKVIPQYGSKKVQGTYAPKLPKIIPIDEYNSMYGESYVKESAHTDLVNKIYSVMANYEYGYDPDMTDIDSMLQELASDGVDVKSKAFKKAWISAHNKAERGVWGRLGDDVRYDSLTPAELYAIDKFDTSRRLKPYDIKVLDKPITISHPGSNGMEDYIFRGESYKKESVTDEYIEITMYDGDVRRYNRDTDLEKFQYDWSEDIRDLVGDDVSSGEIDDIARNLFYYEIPNTDDELTDDDIYEMIRQMLDYEDHTSNANNDAWDLYTDGCKPKKKKKKVITQGCGKKIKKENLLTFKDKNAGFDTSITIDMWYDDEFEPKKYGADAWFNDLEAYYWGWIYDETGKKIGDYKADDSVIIGKYFLIDWGE